MRVIWITAQRVVCMGVEFSYLRHDFLNQPKAPLGHPVFQTDVGEKDNCRSIYPEALLELGVPECFQ